MIVMKKNQVKGILLMSMFVVINLLTDNAYATNYQLVNVGEKLSLEIPKHWYSHSLSERRNISAAGEAIVNSVTLNEPVFVSSLSISSRPEPAGGFIRVSYIPTETKAKQFYQKEFAFIVETRRDEFLHEIESAFAEQFNLLSKGSKGNGLNLLDHGPANIEKINGIYAMTYTYRRPSAYGSSPFKVKQYHIPLGVKKAIVTMSYRESQYILFWPILEKVKNSILINNF
jgi:hypothetical protein